MLLGQNQLLPPISSPNIVSQFPFFISLKFPTHHYSRCSAHKTWIAQLSEQPTAEEGPVELPPSIPSIFATNDEPTPLQTATSLLLTGAITVFLFRSLRRRAKRAKETKFRSSGETKSLAEEAVESFKSMTVSSPNGPPSPVQAFLGALGAGVIALILYKFTLTIESSLNRQTISDNYSVRQITITVRTIINGICYLATFVFGANAVGLLLYSGQLAFNSFMEDFGSEGDASSNPKTLDTSHDSGITSAGDDQSTDNTQ